MRWSIIRLIWMRELRDQLRDRRTLFMIAGLPLILYPVLGMCVLTFALQFFQKPSRIGIVRPANGVLEFPSRPSPFSPHTIAAVIGHGAGGDAIALASRSFLNQASYEYPPLIQGERWYVAPTAALRLPLGLLPRLKIVWLDSAVPDPLEHVDLLLEASEGFHEKLERGELSLAEVADDRPPPVGTKGSQTVRPELKARLRPGDDTSEHTLTRLKMVLEPWRVETKKVRFVRRGLDIDFDEPFDLDEPRGSHGGDPARIEDLVIRIFPFMLVMWSLAGALYPAIDLCAGEKERGTMETLLITPAGREEIVLGKFLTIWVFSAASALLNLFSMGITTSQFGGILPAGSFPLAALFWCILLSLPLSALFSAVSLAIGAYARSTKEGQHYLMPLFLLTMPLIFLTLAPGVELSPFYSLVPVTGVALLMQKLMTSPSLASAPWLYFIPVLAPMALYSALALRWAIDQFQREDVLFREAERLDLSLWLRHLLRDKEPTSSSGQAYFLFALIFGLTWMGLGLGHSLPFLVHRTVSLLAFVATPTLIMTLILNTRPRETLRLHAPRAGEMGLAAFFAVLLLPPLVWFGGVLLADVPQLQRLLENPLPFFQELRALTDGEALSAVFAFALLPAICEELAFRGFILTGLRKKYRPRTAVLLCSFLGGLFHMNVFAFVPIFGLSVVLGLLTLRSGSIVPAILFHFLSKAFLVLSHPLGDWIDGHLSPGLLQLWPYFVSGCFVLALVLFWNLYRKPYWELERREAALPGSAHDPS